MPSGSLKRVRWLAAIYALLIILAVCLANDGRYGIFAWIRGIPGADKVGHFLLMGVLAFVVNIALGLRTFQFATRPWLLGSAVVAALVLLEEISQIWVPSRSFDLLDLAFDFLGILFFGWFAKRVVPAKGSAVETSRP